MPRSIRSFVNFMSVCFIAVSAWQHVASAQVVINEIDYDQPSLDTAEFVELLNVGAAPVNLSGYALRLINGASGGASQYQNYALPSFSLAPGAHYVICGSSANVPNCNLNVSPDSDMIQNGAPDALALMLNGVAVDRVSYEGDVPGFTETASAPADTAAAGESLSRCPNGADSGDNGDDFQLRPITPGAANSCGGGGGELGLCGDAATLISTIQGSGTTSPLVGQTRVIQGVVVGDFQDHGINGFYVQEEDSDSDGNASTSEGVFVFEGALALPLNSGDLVRVLGTVTEFDGLTELSGVQVLVCPGSPSVTTQALSLPIASVGDFERYEGMRVSFSQTLTVTGNFEWGRYGSLDLSANGRLFQPTQIVSPGAASAAQQALNDRSRIILDDASSTQNPNPIPYKDASNTRRLGNTITGLTGILDDRFGAYRVEPTLAPSFSAANVRPAAPGAVGGRIRVASFNVLNFFTTIDTTPSDDGGGPCGPGATFDCRGADSATEFERQRTKLLNALELLDADVVALIELENNASTAAQSLVDGLNLRLGPGSYAFVDTGTIGTDAIKLGFLYKPATASLSGASALLDSSVDPRFVDTRNRPALAQTFREVATGAKFTVINNHLKSKGSSCGAGDDDPSVGGQGNCNLTRTLAADALLDWIASDPTDSADPDVLLLGDLNAYAMEDPITALESGGLENLEHTFLGAGAYSYQFAGQSGTLDYALANAALRPQVTGASVWHINGDEPVVMNYNLEFKTDDPFNLADPFGASDHDPVVIGLNLSGGTAAPVPASPRAGALPFALLLVAIGAFALVGRRRAR